MALTTTPTANCDAGHLHASWYAAETCSRGLAPAASSYEPLPYDTSMDMLTGQLAVAVPGEQLELC